MTQLGRAPDNLPRSPTGRVPQWVRDEAAGSPPSPTGWRTAPLPDLPSSPPRHSGRPRTALSVLVAVAVVGGLVYLAGGPTPRRPQQLAGRPAAPTTLPPASRDAPLPGVGEQPTRLRAAVSGPSDTRFRIAQHQRDEGTPVTYSPCRPIHYVVRRAHEVPGGSAIIDAAVRDIAAATGLSFVSDGATTEPLNEDRRPYQPERYGDRWAPVLITWATKAERPDFGVDVLGLGGSQRVRRPNGSLTFVTGQVDLDASGLAQLNRTMGSAMVRAVVEHELGHVVGLAHVDDAQQLMYPRAQPGVTRLGAGDLAGLAVLGRGACAPDV